MVWPSFTCGAKPINVYLELDNITQPAWVRLILAWGRRNGGRDTPITQIGAASSEELPEVAPYPFMTRHDTAEQALVDANLRDGRRASIKLPPLPPGLM